MSLGDARYPWASRGRGPRTNSATSATAPTNFSQGPTWTWPNKLDEELRHTPLVDEQLNLYLMSTERLRKFSPDGKVLWVFRVPVEDGTMASSPALHDGTVFAFARIGHQGTLYAINMEDGRLKWKTVKAMQTGGDSHAVTVAGDMIILPAESEPPGSHFNWKFGGTNQLWAVSVKDGHDLWKYDTDDILWNFKPSVTADGSLIFSSQCGVVYKVSSQGQLIWKSGTSGGNQTQCSVGGGALGPNGLFYAEYNDYQSLEGARIRAYDVSDGSLVWAKDFPHGYGGWQYPAVGKLGPKGPLALVAAVGSITGPPGPQNEILEQLMPVLSAWAKPSPNTFPLVNAVVALDAATGRELWRSEETPWPHLAMSGDEPILRRIRDKEQRDPRREIMCLPDIQGIPVIAGDGTVYASSSHNGELRAIRDADGNGVIDASEVSTFKTHIGFLNSPAIAPGMVAAAPCWGPMYVFRNSSQV